MESRKTLYVGAHPDDVTLGAGVSIIRNPANSVVLTLTNGTDTGESYPLSHGGITFQTIEEYGTRRISEDRLALSVLGMDVSKDYFNFRLNDLTTHLKIQYIVSFLRYLVKKKGIERIVTHEFPQAHPDHEVASFCSHYTSKDLGPELFEYPMYAYDSSGNEVIRQFLSPQKDIIELSPSEKEARLLEEARLKYQTQRSITPMFAGFQERFSRVTRSFSNGNIPGTEYIFGKDKGYPSPQEVRDSIKRFLIEANPKPI